MKLKENMKECGKNMAIVFSAIAAAGLLGFVVLMHHVWVDGGLPWDDAVRQAFYNMRSPGLTTLMEFITYLGEWYSIVLICVLLLAYPKTRVRMGMPVASAAIATQLVMKIVKHIVSRPRPEIGLRLIEQNGYSFPSGHAITSIAVYGMCFFFLLCYFEKSAKKTALLVAAALLSIAIGISRVYLGVHFPSDVLAGWCLGAAISSIIMIICICRRSTSSDHAA